GLAQTLARRYSAAPPPRDWLDRRVAEIPGSSRSGWPEDHLELAVLQLAREDHAAAVAALQAAVEDGWRDRAYLQTSALFQPLAGDPAFVRVLEDIAGRVRREREAAAASIAAATASR
ncbi:MAG TPA: hypothetical protein VM847_21170, partial [Tahibacter sp.]|nr:hypothetical protein [Tahibacter sp.]